MDDETMMILAVAAVAGWYFFMRNGQDAPAPGGDSSTGGGNDFGVRYDLPDWMQLDSEPTFRAQVEPYSGTNFGVSY